MIHHSSMAQEQQDRACCLSGGEKHNSWLFSWTAGTG